MKDIKSSHNITKSDMRPKGSLPDDCDDHFNLPVVWMQKWRSAPAKIVKSDCISVQHNIPEISEHNPGALFRKSLSNNIDFLNSGPGVVFRNLQYLFFKH